MKVLVTGSAGFIGFHLTQRLLADGHQVLGFDGMTSYYDTELKEARHARLRRSNAFSAIEGMLEDKPILDAAIADFSPDAIVHLAAQAGVRYSLDHPDTYVSANLLGTFNLLEAVRVHPVRHLLLASTSSVYGGNEKMPFREADRTDFPVSLYAATKKACEAMSHSYAHLWKIPTTCFRFFTVYGPWGRPDMAPHKFVDAISQGKPIDVYGHGRMRRDFTYIDDLIEAIVRLIDIPPREGTPVVTEGITDSLSPVAPWRSVNIGSGNPVELMDFIATIETALGRRAEKNMLEMQKGDVSATFADPALLHTLVGELPVTPLAEGVGNFVEWYREWKTT